MCYSATVLQLEFGCPFLNEIIFIYLYIKYIDIQLRFFDSCKTNCSNCSAVADCFVESHLRGFLFITFEHE